MFIVRKLAAVLGVVGRDKEGNIIEGYVIKEKTVASRLEVEALQKCWIEVSVHEV